MVELVALGALVRGPERVEWTLEEPDDCVSFIS